MTRQRFQIYFPTAVNTNGLNAMLAAIALTSNSLGDKKSQKGMGDIYSEIVEEGISGTLPRTPDGEVELWCGDDWPLGEAQICDGLPDCADSEDEVYCGDYGKSPSENLQINFGE